MVTSLKNKDYTKEDSLGRHYISSEEEFKINERERERDLERSKKILHHQESLLYQRNNQRNVLFYYCLISISILICIMFVILYFQICYRIDSGKDLINPSIYNTVFVAVIIQFIGVIYIIAKKLWDEKDIIPLYSIQNH